ncbi:hypothetical protein [Anaerosacchariphilus polymeriproducens]|uniref:Uncharacterized protein n=1 Tax=Anaerosacchariphilus polymeriproducens TaxID=1812858 RepID=A0A371B077_9FIRM|nr:hypothetical protein [Anaerosacchariphilus polymeriproducens]RDU25193.1 hypothetical protein DWV06_00515 [Anaerosacchariphilus polymeriproducens]
MIIEFIPLEGIKIDNKTIRFGATKEEVIKALGIPDDILDGMLYYDNIGLRIELDKNMKVSFAESWNEENIKLKLYNINPLEIECETVLKLLEEKNKGKIEYEGGYNYYFLNLSLGIGRELTTSDVLDMIKEAKAENVYEEMKEQLLSDLKKSKYFESIGLGTKGYYVEVKGGEDE